jgi:hypothetical protein
MGYHGQLIKQSQITVRGRQSIDLNLGSLTQTHGRLPSKEQLSEAVSKNPRVGIESYSPGCKVSWYTPQSIQSHTIHPPSR